MCQFLDDFLRLLLPHHPHGLGEWGGWYLAWEMSQLVDGTSKCGSVDLKTEKQHIPNVLKNASQTKYQWMKGKRLIQQTRFQ